MSFPAPSGPNPNNPNPIGAAEQRVREAEAVHVGAVTKRDAAREAVRLAAESCDRAKTLAASLAQAHDDAGAAVNEAERVWSSDPRPDTWARVEGTRAARDQAELRRRTANGAHVVVEAELRAAEGRLQADERTVIETGVELKTATYILDGYRNSQRAILEEEARVKGMKEAQAREAMARSEAFHRDTVAVLSPMVARYLRAVRELRAAEMEMDEAVALRRPVARQLASERGFLGAVPVDVDLYLSGGELAAWAARQSTEQLNRHSSATVVASIWGDAPNAVHRLNIRVGDVNGRNLAFDVINAARGNTNPSSR